MNQPVTEKHFHIRHLVACFSLTTGVILALLLTLLYQWIGDTYWFTDAIVVYPPVMWSIPLALALIPVLLGRSWRMIAAAALLMLLFLLINEEWRSLLRPAITPASPRSHLRVVTWNIYGLSNWSPVLSELEQWSPDIIVFTETPDDAASDAIHDHLSGPWQGYHWLDQGDCALLSRWPMETLESRKTGPWDKPVLARVTAPAEGNATSTHSLLLCGVRLMMPASASSPINWFGETEQWPAIHNQRVEQYSHMAELLRDNRVSTEPVIIAGDFNVRAGSKSLGILSHKGYHDTWPKAGTGWGGTFMVELPIARIDQVWASEQLKETRARVWRGPISDHRYVVTDFSLSANEMNK